MYSLSPTVNTLFATEKHPLHIKRTFGDFRGVPHLGNDERTAPPSHCPTWEATMWCYSWRFVPREGCASQPDPQLPPLFKQNGKINFWTQNFTQQIKKNQKWENHHFHVVALLQKQHTFFVVVIVSGNIFTAFFVEKSPVTTVFGAFTGKGQGHYFHLKMAISGGFLGIISQQHATKGRL